MHDARPHLLLLASSMPPTGGDHPPTHHKQGDAANRRNGMSTVVMRMYKGDQVYASSNIALTGTGDVIAQWTFSGVKVS